MASFISMTSAEFRKRVKSRLDARFGKVKTRNRPRHLEDDLAMECIKEHDRLYADHFIYHVPNGGRRNAFEGGRLKKMGVRKGVLDYHCPEPRGGYVGLWIELKVNDNRLSPEQKIFRSRVEGLGHKVVECRNLADFMYAVNSYYHLPLKMGGL